MAPPVARRNASNDRENIPGILTDLRMKSGAFCRCLKEYGTYITELETEKARLQSMKAEGKETRQQEQVINETEGMIPITRANAEKMANQFAEFWQSRRQIINPHLEKASEEERSKWVKEFGSYERQLTKILKETENNPLEAHPVLERIGNIKDDLQVLSVQGKL